jgi:hypothetical protein
MDVRTNKPFWLSKRFWWNLLTLGFGAASILGAQGVIPGETMAIVNPIGNLILNQISDGAKLGL